MPVTQFFTFLEQSSVTRALNYMHLCDIQAISICRHEWYQETRSRFERVIQRVELPEPEIKLTPSQIAGKVFDSTTPEARQNVFNLVGIIKRDFGGR